MVSVQAHTNKLIYPYFKQWYLFRTLQPTSKCKSSLVTQEPDKSICYYEVKLKKEL